MEGDSVATTTSGAPEQLVIGLAIGIPCGIIILLLVVLICIVLCITLCNTREQEAVEAMYMRRRFQGLSLEEQRRRQKIVKGRNRFVSRRRSSAAESKPSTTQLAANSTRARVIKANPFGLQDWQLKLSGIDIAVDGETEQTDIEPDSPRTPVGAFNPLLLQNPQDQVQPSYEPAHRPPASRAANISSSHTSHSVVPPPSINQAALDGEEDGSSSDSFNPYD